MWLKKYWVSAYDYTKHCQTGSTMIARDDDELFFIFKCNYEDCDIEDYGEYEEPVWAEDYMWKVLSLADKGRCASEDDISRTFQFYDDGRYERPIEI